VLVELMREYQALKTSITAVLDSTEAVVDIGSALKDHEETKRSLSKVGHITSLIWFCVTKTTQAQCQNAIMCFFTSPSCPVLVQHEAVKTAMAAKQRELDLFSSRGKQLLSELKNIPECDAQAMKKDVETLVDQWLDVRLTLHRAQRLGGHSHL